MFGPLKRLFGNRRTPRLSDARAELLATLPKEAICAEIGVWKGAFSEQILRHTKPKRLHLIDPWAFQDDFPDRMYGGSVAKDQSDMDAIHDEVARKFGSLSNVVIDRGMSDEVMGRFADDYFDWVYIDGNHYYDFVLRDLELARAKVRPGGIIAGDDYNWGSDIGLPVKKAVQDFAAAHELERKIEIIESQFLIRL